MKAVKELAAESIETGLVTFGTIGGTDGEVSIIPCEYRRWFSLALQHLCEPSVSCNAVHGSVRPGATSKLLV